MLVGCYSIHVYCSNTEASSGESRFVCSLVTPGMKDGGFAEASGETEGECIRLVRATGWKIDKRNDRHFCPACVRDKKVW